MLKGISVYIQNRLLLERIRTYCFFLFFSFFFIFFQPFTSASSPAQERVNKGDKTSYYSGDLFNSSHLPLYFPFAAGQTPNQPEDPDEDELKDTLDDDWNPWILKHSFKNYFNIFSTLRSRFLNISQCLQNRSAISLFILYHSWKSYLL